MVGRVVRVMAGGVVLLALVDGVFGQGGLIENGRLRAQNVQSEEAAAELRQQNEAFREQSRRLKEDPAAIEDLARRDLGLMKQGELVIIMRDVPTATPTSPDSLRQDKKKH